MMTNSTSSMNVEVGTFVKRPTPIYGEKGVSHDPWLEDRNSRVQYTEDLKTTAGTPGSRGHWKIAGANRKNKKDALEERTCIIWGMSESISLIQIRNFIVVC